MSKMGAGGSPSWWWDKNARPKHSKWLQENVNDVEINVKAMLNIVDCDADSFAKRAEMYYQKRPELLNLVEQFFRGYRVLAERYDQLSANIRQNVPPPLQLQYGLVIDSPKASPFGKQLTFRKQNSNMDTWKDSNSHQETIEISTADEDAGSEVSSSETKTGNTADGEDSSSSSSSSDSEAENVTNIEIQKLQQTVAHLRVENKTLSDRCRERFEQYKDAERRVHGLREDVVRLQKEINRMRGEANLAARKFDDEKQVLESQVAASLFTVNELQSKLSLAQEEARRQNLSSAEVVQGLEEEKTRLLNDVVVTLAAFRFAKGAVTSVIQSNKRLKEEHSGLQLAVNEKEALVLSLQEQVRTLEAENFTILQKTKELETKLELLKDENKQQAEDILDCAEGKRAVIRELSSSIYIYKENIHRLQDIVKVCMPSIKDSLKRNSKNRV